MKIEIEMSLDDVVGVKGYGHNTEPITLRDAVVSATAERVFAELDAEAVTMIRTRVTQLTDEEIKNQVEPLVRKAIEQRVQPRLGAKESTLEEHIMEIVRQELRSSRDRYGDSFGSRGQGPLLARIVREEVEIALTRELKGELDAAKDKVRAAVRDRAADVLAETITRMSRSTS